MPERVIATEFRNEVEFSRYPFGDAASLQTKDGQFNIGVDTFIDATLYPIGGSSRLHISNINVTAREIVISIGDNANPTLATATFDPVDAPDNVPVFDAHSRPAGVLVSEALRLSRFSGWPAGDHSFDSTAAEFAATVIIPVPVAGVNGLLTGVGEIVAGDVWLVGDDGVVLREENGNIRIDIVGDPLFRRKLCTGSELFDSQTFLQTINDCPPDKYGNFAIPVAGDFSEDTVLRVYPGKGGLVIEAVGKLNREE